jgi:hypothetical protein
MSQSPRILPSIFLRYALRKVIQWTVVALWRSGEVISTVNNRNNRGNQDVIDPRLKRNGSTQEETLSDRYY